MHKFPNMHARTTALEIISDFEGDALDYWVTGYGTGGTLNGVSRVLAEKSFVYDAATPLRGLLTESGACIEWNLAACTRWKTSTYRHDRAGNVTAVIGPVCGATQTAYDENLLYARSTRNAVGHVTESTRDLRNGRETPKRAPNGRVFETEYDGLGRPVRSWVARDSAARIPKW